MIRLPDCKLLAQGHHSIGNNCRCGSTVTSISHHFGSVAQLEEQPVVCGKGPCGRPPRVQIPSGPPISNLTARLIPRVSALRISTPAFLKPLGASARSVAVTHSAWDRGIAGATPAALTNFSSLPWSNISGIRLLNGTMQVRTLPAAPLPDSVKVARRPVKPRGVGANPTLAA